MFAVMEERPTATLDGKSLGARAAPVRLVVLSGPDVGLSLDVREGTALVGTHADCQLRLSDPGVSRRHLSVELLGPRVRVTDQGSKNGTRYLGARVTSLEVPLGGSVDLGQTTLAILPLLRAGALSDKQRLGELLGRSTAMRRLFAQLEQVGPSEASCVVVGETGTGKELVARTLHALSPRASRPFVVVDCGALTGPLVQATLFGHVRGAFTGAVKDAVGLIGAAQGGTLLLDEVAALPLEAQPLLLRVLESRTYQRVGDGVTREADFRAVATSTEDLGALVSAGRLRSDLSYRLAAITLEVPPLRARLDDVPLLAQHFATAAGAKAPLSPAALAGLTAWRWPGNVRELRHAVERAVTLGEAPLPVAEGAREPEDFHAARDKALQAFERSYLEALLEKHKGSASAVAREAGIARSYLYRLLEAHGLEPEHWRR
jgi:DNA-binding NtrC family response regulator